MTLIAGYLWQNIRTVDDVKLALKKHPDTKEIHAAQELEEPLSSLDGVRVVYEREVPEGHVFLVRGEDDG